MPGKHSSQIRLSAHGMLELLECGPGLDWLDDAKPELEPHVGVGGGSGGVGPGVGHSTVMSWFGSHGLPHI